MLDNLVPRFDGSGCFSGAQISFPGFGRNPGNDNFGVVTGKSFDFLERSNIINKCNTGM